MPWSRLVSVGDSFTEGMVDPDPDRPGHYRGWADRLAVGLAERSPSPGDFRYANLAVRGRLLADVVGPQLDAALALQPDLVTISGGVNDMLRPKVDLDALAATLDEAVGRVRATGADVVLFTICLPTEFPVLKLGYGRSGVLSAHANSIARRHGAYLVDLWGAPVLRQPRLWASDRIHLTTRGHEIVTLLTLIALGVLPPDGAGAGVAAEGTDDDLTLEARLNRLADGAGHVDSGLRAHLSWAKEYATPWVRRRLTGQSSGDQVSAKRPGWSAL